MSSLIARLSIDLYYYFWFNLCCMLCCWAQTHLLRPLPVMWESQHAQEVMQQIRAALSIDLDYNLGELTMSLLNAHSSEVIRTKIILHVHQNALQLWSPQKKQQRADKLSCLAKTTGTSLSGAFWLPVDTKTKCQALLDEGVLKHPINNLLVTESTWLLITICDLLGIARPPGSAPSFEGNWT